MLVMARSDEYIWQLVASEAIIAASSKKKDVATIVSQGIAVVKYPYQGDHEHIKGGALGGLCKLGASEVTTGNRLAAPGALMDRQDKR